MKKKVSFTGHRPEKLTRTEEEIKAELKEYIEQAEKEGIYEFICGMARGVDLWAADLVLEMRKKNCKIKLICMIPYKSFSKKWGTYWKEKFDTVLKSADEIHYIQDSFSYSSFMERNKMMVDHSDIVIAVYNGEPGGTHNTVEYAKSVGKVLYIIKG